MLKSDPPGSIRYVDGNELREMKVNPKLRQEFEDDIRVLVSILNANNVRNDTIILVNEQIRKYITDYHAIVLAAKES